MVDCELIKFPAALCNACPLRDQSRRNTAAEILRTAYLICEWGLHDIYRASMGINSGGDTKHTVMNTPAPRHWARGLQGLVRPGRPTPSK